MITTQEQLEQPALSAALYVGDLNPDVTETILFKYFGGESVVTSTKICRDMTTKRSLGYGYVNFRTAEDAKNALEHRNYTIIIDRPCRIMWSVRDPSKRKDNRGNLYIKNIDKSVDARTIYQAFVEFGTILSFKIVTDDFGNSKGYGFIHFATETEAKYVMEKVNGLNFKGKNLVVCPFIPKRDRSDTVKSVQYTNLYVKNLPENATEESLREIFGKFGTITSCRVMRDEQGVSRRFGFVCFENQDQAASALSLNNSVLDGRSIYVAVAQSKDERRYQLAYRFSQLKLGNGVSQVRMMQNQPPFAGAQFPPNAIPPGADMRQFRNMPGDRNQMRNPQHAPIFMQQFGGPPPQGYIPPNARHMPSYMGHMQHFHQRMRQPQRGGSGQPQSYQKGANVNAPMMMEQGNMQPQHMPMRPPMQGGRLQNMNPPQQVPANEVSLREHIIGLPNVDECFENNVFRLPADIKNKIGKKILDFALPEYGDDARVVVSGLLEKPQIIQIANHPEMIKRAVASHIQQYRQARQQPNVAATNE